MIELLLRAYPRAWRDRYGEELRQLLSDTGLTPDIAFDVIRAGLRERAGEARLAIRGGLTMTLGPAWRHPSGWAAVALLVLAPTLLFVAMSILAYQLGVTDLVKLMEPVSSWLQANRLADLVLVAAPAVALALAATPLVRFELGSSAPDREAVVRIRLRAANVAVAVLAALVGGVLVGYFLAEAAV